MKSWSSSFCIALILFIRRSKGTEPCSKERSANCCENNATYQADSFVSFEPQTAVSCCFEGNLCQYSQGCVDTGMGNWSANSGYASVSQRTHGSGRNVYSVLESPWVNVSTQSCIEFTYSRGTPYQLQVFLAFHNVEPPCLVKDSEGVAYNTNRTARFSITPMTGKIQFRVFGGGAGSASPPPKLYHVTILGGGCVHQDGQSALSPAQPPPMSIQCRQVSVTKSTSTTRHPTTSDRKCPMSSTVGDMTSPDGESDNSAAAIAGVMVTVVVLIVVIIVVVIVCRRKRRQSKPDDKNSNTEDLPMTTGGTNTGITASERAGNPLSRRDDDYTDIDVAITPSSDINPYELADDGTNNNGSLGPNLQRLNGRIEDDYSRIDEAQPAAAHSREKNMEQVQPNPKDVYSVVNKPGKKTPTPVYSLAKNVGEKPALPNPSDVYSVVNRKAKKFYPAAKPGQPDAEYNTISHNGNTTSSQKAPSDATPDTYNRIGAVPSLGLNEIGRASTKLEDGLLTDDYNKLNLAKNGSMKEKSEAAGAAYDHVRNDPDDAYSKARIGKRNVVIDSDYHRLKP